MQIYFFDSSILPGFFSRFPSFYTFLCVYDLLFFRQIANPTAMFLCCADLLQHLRLQQYGAALRLATEAVIAEGKVKTRDIGGSSSTLDFTDAVIQKYTL